MPWSRLGRRFAGRPRESRRRRRLRATAESAPAASSWRRRLAAERRRAISLVRKLTVAKMAGSCDAGDSRPARPSRARAGAGNRDPVFFY